jgi:hypothetical protein
MKVTLKKSILYLLPMFITSLLNFYLFILESKGLVIFLFFFSEFQRLGDKYAKYILYCAFVIINPMVFKFSTILTNINKNFSFFWVHLLQIILCHNFFFKFLFQSFLKVGGLMYVFAALWLLCNIVILTSSQRKVRWVPRIGLETDTQTTSFLKMAIKIKKQPLPHFMWWVFLVKKTVSPFLTQERFYHTMSPWAAIYDSFSLGQGMGFLGNLVFPNVFLYGSFVLSPKCPMFIYYAPNLFLKFSIAHFIPNVLLKIFLL